jgi:hypothetical protein
MKELVAIEKILPSRMFVSINTHANNRRLGGKTGFESH